MEGESHSHLIETIYSYPDRNIPAIKNQAFLVSKDVRKKSDLSDPL